MERIEGQCHCGDCQKLLWTDSHPGWYDLPTQEGLT